MITIEVEKLIAMFIIACGEWNGVQWEYFPKLPKCFSDNLNFQNSCGCNADLLCIRVNNLFKVDVWFADEDGDTFWYDLDDVKKTHPMLFVALFTHVFDMIENLKEC